MVISHEKQGEQHVNIKEQYQFYYKILGFHVSFVEDLCLLMCLWIGVFWYFEEHSVFSFKGWEIQEEGICLSKDM